MTVLVDIQNPNWMSREQFLKALDGGIPSNQIQFYPDLAQATHIEMLVCDRLRSELPAQLPNLALVQKLGAGVETIIYADNLAENITVARLKPQIIALEMARYCLAYVLSEVHHLACYRDHQLQSQWQPKAPRLPANITVGVLGLGHIGATVARLFHSLEFTVIGWSRTQKAIDGVACRCGLQAMDEVLAQCDYVICVLPATADTANLFDRERFKAMKPNATLINIGRGSLIVERDLLVALDNKCMAHAILDVFQQEPLADDSPLWTHPSVTVTPHISGWHLHGLQVVADNYNALISGKPLTNVVSRARGY